MLPSPFCSGNAASSFHTAHVGVFKNGNGLISIQELKEKSNFPQVTVKQTYISVALVVELLVMITVSICMVKR